MVEAWSKKLQPDTVFRRVPAIFNERWAHDAAIFYAFEAMGVLDKVHKPFFDAIHRDLAMPASRISLQAMIEASLTDDCGCARLRVERPPDYATVAQGGRRGFIG